MSLKSFTAHNLRELNGMKFINCFGDTKKIQHTFESSSFVFKMGNELSGTYCYNCTALTPKKNITIFAHPMFKRKNLCKKNAPYNNNSIGVIHECIKKPQLKFQSFHSSCDKCKCLWS